MKFYARKVFTNAFGKPFKDQGAEGKEIDMSLGWAAMSVLWGEIATDKSAPSNLKIHRHRLALKIKDFLDRPGSEDAYMDIPAEDLAMIKTRIVEAYITPLAGSWVESVESESPRAVAEDFVGEARV